MSSLEEENGAAQAKRAKVSDSKDVRTKSKDKKRSSKSSPDSISNKRQRKIDKKPQNSNKGLIGSAMTLSVVGLLNYMG